MRLYRSCITQTKLLQHCLKVDREFSIKDFVCCVNSSYEHGCLKVPNILSRVQAQDDKARKVIALQA